MAEDLLLSDSILGGDKVHNDSNNGVQLVGQSMKFNEIKGKYSASHIVMFGTRNLYVGSGKGELFKINLVSILRHHTKTRL